MTGCPHGGACACVLDSRHGWLEAFSAAKKERDALEQALRQALDLLRDVCVGHSHPDAAEYQQCDTEPCALCEEYADLSAAADARWTRS